MDHKDYYKPEGLLRYFIYEQSVWNHQLHLKFIFFPSYESQQAQDDAC